MAFAILRISTSVTNCYQDAANAKSNQKNLGTIKSSNLCTEIIEYSPFPIQITPIPSYFLSRYSSADETAVCNLASLNLQKFIACAQVQSSTSIPELSKSITSLSTSSQAPGSRPYFDFERLVRIHDLSGSAYCATKHSLVCRCKSPVL